MHKMQTEAFRELLDKYQDYDTSPANEAVEKVLFRLQQEFTCFYFICLGERKVGAVRVVDKKETGKIGKTKEVNERLTLVFYEKGV